MSQLHYFGTDRAIARIQAQYLADIDGQDHWLFRHMGAWWVAPLHHADVNPIMAELIEPQIDKRT